VARTLKVNTNVTIEIDLDALEAEYGRPYTVAEAREEVKDSVPGILQQVLFPETSNIVISVRSNW
jgi:hypothetical protein